MIGRHSLDVEGSNLRLRTNCLVQRAKTCGLSHSPCVLTALKKSLNSIGWRAFWYSSGSCTSRRYLKISSPNVPIIQHLKASITNRLQLTLQLLLMKWQPPKAPKMGEPLSICWSHTLPMASKITTVTVSEDGAERYFSLFCDDAVMADPDLCGKVGIDLGLTHFATLSAEEKRLAHPTRSEKTNPDLLSCNDGQLRK